MGGSTVEIRRLLAGRLLMGFALLVAGLLAPASAAEAVITPPTVIDGPSVDGIVLGDVAMAADGTGGLVYTKTVDGKPHVFASRYDGSSWSAVVQRLQADGYNDYCASCWGGRYFGAIHSSVRLIH